MFKKKILLFLALLLTFSISIRLTYAYSNFTAGNAALNLNYKIAEPITLGNSQIIQYTPFCVDCYMPIEVKYSGTIALASQTLKTSDLNYYKAKIVGTDTLSSVEYFVIVNETFTEPSNQICTNITNVINSSWSLNCVDDKLIIKWRYVKKPFNSLTVGKDSSFILLLHGTMSPNTNSSIDIVPSLFNINMSALAWWNTSYVKCKNMTTTNNAAFYPAFTNLTYDSDMLANFSDVVFVNSSCNNGGTAAPQFMTNNISSSWATYRLLTNNSGTINSVYYSNLDSVNSKDNADNVFGSGLLFYAPFDEDIGTTAFDKINVNGYNPCALLNAPAWVAGLQGYALDFERDNSNYLGCGDYNDVTTGLTLCAWIKPESYSSTNEYLVISKASSASSGSWVWGLYGNGSVRFDIRTSAFQGATYSSRIAPIGTWSFICSTYDGVNRVTYVNGTNTSVTATTGTISNSVDNMTIGSFISGTHHFDGLIDEPKVYNVALTAAQISNMYATTEPTFSYGNEEDEPIPAQPTLVNLWINGGVGNITTSCSVESTNNYTAQINITGLPISIMYNNTHGNTNTTIVNWYASLIAGYWKILANWSGNSSYAQSNSTLYHNITLGNATSNVSLTFNTTPNGNNTSCVNTSLMINCSSWVLEDSVKLYNDTHEIGFSYNFTPLTNGKINFTCNWTQNDCYTSGSITRNLTIDNCTPPLPPNYTSTGNMTNVYIHSIINTLYCSDNNTLLQKYNISNESVIIFADCPYGCDNVTMACNMPKYQQNLIILTIVIIGSLFLIKVIT